MSCLWSDNAREPQPEPAAWLWSVLEALGAALGLGAKPSAETFSPCDVCGAVDPSGNWLPRAGGVRCERHYLGGAE